MAIINNKDETNTYLDIWRNELRKHFNSIRIFNAHMATYAQRIALLESLKAIDQQWEKTLGTVIQAFKNDWSRRIATLSFFICDMIQEAQRFQASWNFSDEEQIESLRHKLITDYKKEITRIEKQTHSKIKKLFKHNIFDYALPEQSIAGEDLFEQKTWAGAGAESFAACSRRCCRRRRSRDRP